MLEVEFTSKEVLGATKAFSTHEAPSHDDVLVEFFMEFWDQLD